MSGDDSEIRTLGTLLTLAVHDLRNPLSVLLTNVGYLETVLASGDVVEARTVVSDLFVACDALGRYLANVDALASHLGDRPLVRSRTSTRSIVENAVQRAAIPIEQQGTRVRLDLATDCPDVVVDVDLAVRAVENLLGNALIFAPRGSEVLVTASALPDDRVRISVFDDGVPVPAAHRAEAFSSTGQDALQRSSGARYGRGLGLLVAGIAAARLGGAAAAREHGPGCRFDLDLPATSSDDPSSPGL